MHKQKGAALVVVLALLAGAMIVGVSGMQGSLINERLAGNYRASVLAQMAAESGAAKAYFADMKKAPRVGPCEKFREKVIDKKARSSSDYFSLPKKNKISLGYYAFNCVDNEKERKVVVGQVKSQSMDKNNINEYVVSFAYTVRVPSDDNADITVVSGEEGVELEGSAKVVGNIKTLGEVELDGNSSVEGNVESGDEDGVELEGSSSISGNVKTPGNVEISGGSKVGGEIEAGGDIEVPDRWNDDDINKKEGDGNIDYDGFISSSGLPDVRSLYKLVDKHTRKLKSPIYGYDEIEVGDYPRVDGYFEDEGLKVFNKKSSKKELLVEGDKLDVSYIPCLDGEATVVRIEDFDQYNGILEVKTNTVLVVDDDFTLGDGGGKSLVFSGEEAALTVFVTGEVELHSALDMRGDSVINENGQPRLVIYALGDEDDDDGGDVEISGSAHVVAKIYAPQSKIEIEGSSTLTGAIWGNEVELSGSSSFTAAGSLTSCTGGSASAGGGTSGGGTGEGFWWH